jgi:hypothetical protein
MNSIVYYGKGTEVLDIFSLEQSGAVVTALVGPYMDKGHTVWRNN